MKPSRSAASSATCWRRAWTTSSWSTTARPTTPPSRAAAAGATVVREPRRGYGRACAAGVAALPPETEIVCFLDGDGSDVPAFLPAVVGPIADGKADFVMGSRLRGRREPGSMTPQQIVAGWLAGVLLRLTYGVRFTDMSPFRAMRLDRLRALGMSEQTYGWNLEMQMRVGRGRLAHPRNPGRSSAAGAAVSPRCRATWSPASRPPGRSPTTFLRLAVSLRADAARAWPTRRISEMKDLADRRRRFHRPACRARIAVARPRGSRAGFAAPRRSCGLGAGSRRRASSCWSAMCATAAAIDRALAGVDAVLHLAAKVGLGVDVGDLPDYASSNDAGTAELLAGMARAGVSRLTLASSMVVYGEGVRPLPGAWRGDAGAPEGKRAGGGSVRAAVSGVRPAARPPALVSESAPLDPRNAYASSKVAQEFYGSNWARVTGGSVAAMRYHNVYGPGMPRDTPYAGVAAIFTSALRRGEAPQVFEDGGSAAISCMSAMSRRRPCSPARSIVSGVRAFNVGSGTPRTVGEMARALAAGAEGTGARRDRTVSARRRPPHHGRFLAPARRTRVATARGLRGGNGRAGGGPVTSHGGGKNYDPEPT